MKLSTGLAARISKRSLGITELSKTVWELILPTVGETAGNDGAADVALSSGLVRGEMLLIGSRREKREAEGEAETEISVELCSWLSVPDEAVWRLLNETVASKVDAFTVNGFIFSWEEAVVLTVA